VKNRPRKALPEPENGELGTGAVERL
jgi:hypothetical protein